MPFQITDGSKRLILASSANSLEPRHLDGDTHIYANDCTMSKNVRARNLNLHTSSFAVLSSDSTIDVSGEAGVANVQAGDKHADGESGHSVSNSSANFKAGQPVRVLSRGGKGANGYSRNDENGGDGGSGGNGGSIKLMYNDTFRVEYMATITHPDNLVKTIEDFHDGYAIDRILSALDLASARFAASIKSLMGYDSGRYGVAATGPPRGWQQQVGRPYGLGFDQVAMTLRDAGNHYFLGSRQSLTRCAHTLRVMIDRLDFLDHLKTDDALFKAYATGETNLFILPSGTSKPKSIVSLKHSLWQARGYLARMGKNLDIYCHAPTWVPRGSYTFCKQQLDAAVDGFSEIVSNYFECQSSVSDQAKKRETEQDTTAELIRSYSPLLGLKRKAPKAEIEKVRPDIKTHFDVSFSDFIDAAAQMAFATGLSVAIVQGARLYYDAKTTMPDGSSIKKYASYL
ncbi:hypothetical protein B0H63DRAFT_540887 [Podospora didyma]|uniref:Uncharacterized protein n=1 Tax=Podospora didyma TaxID=330526 RepID=A0AAE0NSC8_9PEZI|nr:hypothetical protein B0H63DRAFT_540887 [Podospora didyma]